MILSKLMNHYIPAPSRIACLQLFYHRDQGKGLICGCPEESRETCKFVDLDNYLLDHLMSRVRDSHLKRRLIAKPTLMFQEALNEACVAELANLSLADMPRGQSPPKSKKAAVHFGEATPPYDSEDDDEDVHRL